MANETNGRVGTKYTHTSKEKWEKIFGKKPKVSNKELDRQKDGRKKEQ